MNRNIRGAAFAAAPFLLGSAAHAQWSDAYSAPRNALVDANGAGLIEVQAAANGDNHSVALDLVIEVPQGMNADVADGSGELKILNVGSVELADGSNDGSGEIDATKIGRDFTVESKGSGSIHYREVSGQVDIPSRHRHRDRDGNR